MAVGAQLGGQGPEQEPAETRAARSARRGYAAPRAACGGVEPGHRPGQAVAVDVAHYGAQVGSVERADHQAVAGQEVLNEQAVRR